jgi:hypothetical protein
MKWVSRPPTLVDGSAEADPFGALYRSIVVGLADRLVVPWVPEEPGVALVRDTMVHDGGGDRPVDPFAYALLA